MTIRRMRIACWITKATDTHTHTHTHTEYVILIDLHLQQWLQQRASLLRHSTLPVLYSTERIQQLHLISTPNDENT